MLRKGLSLLTIFCINHAWAAIEVKVENMSREYNAHFISRDAEISIYTPEPIDVLLKRKHFKFGVLSLQPETITIADFEYGYGPENGGSLKDPSCHFKLVVIRDYRTGRFVAQKPIAKSESRSPADRTRCSANITAFDDTTGDASITFNIDRRKV